MNESLVELLACPQCLADLTLQAERRWGSADAIESGSLQCVNCRRQFPIRDGIPRFVPPDHDADRFNPRWTSLREIQMDSYNRSTLSRDHLCRETTINPDTVQGKRVLEVGCGAGRFLEVLSETGCRLVGVDLSGAVDAAGRTVGHSPNTDIVQANILALPFKNASFDVCYSIGALQHTPDPAASLESLPRVLKPGGHLAIALDERESWSQFHSKHLVRRLTRGWNQKRLLASIIEILPLVYPVARRLFALPMIGRAVGVVLPIADCTRLPGLSAQDRYRFTLLDTFDMLTPRHDSPLTADTVRSVLAASGITELRRTSPTGLSVIGTKPA